MFLMSIGDSGAGANTFCIRKVPLPYNRKMVGNFFDYCLNFGDIYFD